MMSGLWNVFFGFGNLVVVEVVSKVVCDVLYFFLFCVLY